MVHVYTHLHVILVSILFALTLLQASTCTIASNSASGKSKLVEMFPAAMAAYKHNKYVVTSTAISSAKQTQSNKAWQWLSILKGVPLLVCIGRWKLLLVLAQPGLQSFASWQPIVIHTAKSWVLFVRDRWLRKTYGAAQVSLKMQLLVLSILLVLHEGYRKTMSG